MFEQRFGDRPGGSPGQCHDDEQRYLIEEHRLIPIEAFAWHLRNGMMAREIRAFAPHLLESAQHVFYTGPIDRFFGLSSGRLSYRTIYFEALRADGDFQGNPVINYPEMDVPYTRIHEHKHFAQWEKHARSTILIEHSKETGPTDVPYYPKRLKCDIEVFNSLVKRAEEQRGISFLGRLGTYRYLNMDQVIGEALDFAKIVLRRLAAGAAIPTFPASCGKQGAA